MAQGALKPKAKSALSKTKTLHSARQKQKNAGGNKVVKPKHRREAQHREMARKGAAGLTGQLEKQLAERAGYTEMVSAKDAKRRGATGMNGEVKGGAGGGKSGGKTAGKTAGKRK